MPSAERNLAATIHRLLKRVGGEVASAAKNDKRPPPLTRHLPLFVDTLTPLVAPFAIRGGRQAVARIRGLLRRRRRKSLAAVGRYKADAGEVMGFDLSLFNERILEAIRRLTFDFCQETLATSTRDTEDAYALLRDELAEGLSKGEAVNRLGKRVETIFADPNRAYTIARTEGHRAVMAGEVIAAKESGVVSAKEWLVSPGACDKCEALAGKVVGLDEPFATIPGRGLYSTVFHPPYHPRCTCAVLFRITED